MATLPLRRRTCDVQGRSASEGQVKHTPAGGHDQRALAARFSQAPGTKYVGCGCTRSHTLALSGSESIHSQACRRDARPRRGTRGVVDSFVARKAKYGSYPRLCAPDPDNSYRGDARRSISRPAEISSLVGVDYICRPNWVENDHGHSPG